MKDPRRFDEKGCKFGVREVAAIYADEHHPLIDKKLRPMIARLIRENAEQLRRIAKEKAQEKKNART